MCGGYLGMIPHVVGTIPTMFGMILVCVRAAWNDFSPHPEIQLYYNEVDDCVQHGLKQFTTYSFTPFYIILFFTSSNSFPHVNLHH